MVGVYESAGLKTKPRRVANSQGVLSTAFLLVACETTGDVELTVEQCGIIFARVKHVWAGWFDNYDASNDMVLRPEERCAAFSHAQLAPHGHRNNGKHQNWRGFPGIFRPEGAPILVFRLFTRPHRRPTEAIIDGRPGRRDGRRFHQYHASLRGVQCA